LNLQIDSNCSDGTIQLQFTPEQFIKRIISIIPPPRQNLIRYIGVFGARHKKRGVITSMTKSKAVKPRIKKKIYRTPLGMIALIFPIDRSLIMAKQKEKESVVLLADANLLVKIHQT
jgi:hypothetical protein